MDNIQNGGRLEVVRRRRHSACGRNDFGVYYEPLKEAVALRRHKSCGDLPNNYQKKLEKKTLQNSKPKILVRLPDIFRFTLSDHLLERLQNYAQRQKYIGAVRLVRELHQLCVAPPDHCSVAPSSKNYLKWHAQLLGAPGSPYENGVFALSILFSTSYPFKPPKVCFKTRIYHCNIDRRGNVGMNTLKSKWTPALTVSKMLLCIQQLMVAPQRKHTMVPQLAHLYMQDRAKYNSYAKLYTKIFALNTANSCGELVLAEQLKNGAERNCEQLI